MKSGPQVALKSPNVYRKLQFDLASFDDTDPIIPPAAENSELLTILYFCHCRERCDHLFWLGYES